MLRRVNFLQGSKMFQAEVPDRLVGVRAGSVVVLNNAERDLAFESASAAVDPDRVDNWAHVVDFAQAPHRIAVYQQNLEPRFYVAVWRLSDGYLQTFVDAPTPGLDALRSVTEAITVVDAKTSAPKIALKAPLRRGDVREFDERERISFTSVGAGLPTSLEFRENPGSRDHARVVDALAGNSVEVWAVRSGVRVSAFGPAGQLEQLVDEHAKAVNSI